MEKHSVVPDVLDQAPKDMLKVSYSGGKDVVSMGNILTPTQVKKAPQLDWPADSSKYYLICMTDPDAPNRQEPKFREWHHWLVGNIPGTNVGKGEVLTGYVGAAPPKGSGLHRYVLVVYEQPEKLSFDESRIPDTSGNKRAKFSIKKFASKYKLGQPIAANFFQAEWDSYVPTVYKQLKS